MQVYRYGTPNDIITNTKGIVIFLAGPTVRGNQQHLTSWRIEAIKLFEEIGFQGTLIVPEFEDKTESDKGRVELPLWEHNGLKRADCILFWIPRTRELWGLNTNSEQGYWLGKDPRKLVYGRPDDAFRIQYNDIMWNQIFSEIREERDIHNSLVNTIMASIEMTHECVLIGSEKNIFSIAADFANENFPVYEVKGPNENDGVYDVNYEARKAAYNAYIKGATDNN